MLSAHTKIHRHRGFTLIELMIVIVVISILVAIAYPGYRQYMRDAHQSDAQRLMLDVSSRAQQYRMDLNAYPDGFVAGGGDLDMAIPQEVADFYDIALTASAGPPPIYTVTATPKAGTMQDGEATLTLTSTGKKTPAEEW